MSYVWLIVTTLIIVFVTHWIYRWRNPKFNGNGKLPPGSMGFPLIGETIEFFIPSKIVGIQPFVSNRITKYGSLFKTSLVGRPVVISTDAETNFYLLQQEGKLVQVWYMDAFEKLIYQGKKLEASSLSVTHKYLRRIVVKHFGPEAIKENLLPFLEESISQGIHSWSKLPSVELKRALTNLVCSVTEKQLFSYERESIGDLLNNFLQGAMSVPLNIPGTTFHRCLKIRNKVVDLIRKDMQERIANPENPKEDFLGHLTEDMSKNDSKELYLTEDLIVNMSFVVLFASFETISATLTLAISLLTEHPSVVQELEEEHETILKNRGDANSGITWDEYKSMTFTQHVISEILRLGSVAPGFLRRAIKDITINGYTIPKGWTIMISPPSVQLNPNNYDDPLVFNPWRWKHIRGSAVAKKFTPYGGGSIVCPGAEFSKVVMAVFLHKFVTKYRWKKLKGGEVFLTPFLAFGDGFPVQVYEKT